MNIAFILDMNYKFESISKIVSLLVEWHPSNKVKLMLYLWMIEPYEKYKYHS